MATKEPVFTPSHPFAEIFALHDGEPLWQLADQIKDNGLREPCVLLNAQMLDGRRRERACLRAGVKPKYRKFGSRPSDGKDALEFVIDMNLHRRHLGPGERALAAAKYATAKAGRPKSAKNIEETASGKPPQFEEVLPEATNREAAEQFEVTEAQVQRGKVVEGQGTPALQAAVLDGTLSVSDAARVATEPPKVQDAAVQAVRDGEARTATAAIREQEDEKPLLDELDQPVPGNLKEVFEKAKDFQGIVNQLNAINRKLKELVGHPAGAMMRLQQAEIDLKHLKQTVKFDAPYCVCPLCHGKKNKPNCACKGRGWLNKASYENIPTESRI